VTAEALAGRGLSRQTVANARTTLRAALRGAERARAITADHLAELLAEPMPAIQRERAAEMDEPIRRAAQKAAKANLAGPKTDRRKGKAA